MRAADGSQRTGTIYHNYRRWQTGGPIDCCCGGRPLCMCICVSLLFHLCIAQNCIILDVLCRSRSLVEREWDSVHNGNALLGYDATFDGGVAMNRIGDLLAFRLFVSSPVLKAIRAMCIVHLKYQRTPKSSMKKAFRTFSKFPTRTRIPPLEQIDAHLLLSLDGAMKHCQT